MVMNYGPLMSHFLIIFVDLWFVILPLWHL